MPNNSTARPVRQIKFDRERPVRFGFNAVADFCEVRGHSLDFFEKLDGDDVSSAFTLTDVRALTYAGLKDGARVEDEDFELSVEDCGDLLDHRGAAIQEVCEHFGDSVSFGEAEPTEAAGK